MKSRTLAICMALTTIFLGSTLSAQTSQRGLAVSATPSADTWGTYHALIIGINNYKEWPRLQTAVKDAKVIRDTLIARYGFPEKNVILRTDRKASRLQITRDLRYLAQSMRSEDNLFVYYAGHGQLDDFTGDGYWVPAEGALKDPGTWVANSYIKAILSSEKLQAKNVVVIADSCYSGSMLRGGPSLMSLDDQRYREKLAEKAALRSRQVISSGGVEPVADGGAEGPSLFAFYLIDALRKNQREVIDLENLFHTRVWKPVTEIGDQRPNVGRLKTPMDQDGQFVLYNAAWAREQAARRAALAAEIQKKAAAEQKAAVASAEFELQRQRFEMEKQKLALEKEQLAQVKALEMEKLKLEKQKQEIEYAKLQARLAELEHKRQAAEQRPVAVKSGDEYLQAAVDRKALVHRPTAGTVTEVTLLPAKIVSKWGPAAHEQKLLRAINAWTDEDDRLEFAKSYKLIDGLSENAVSIAEIAGRKENQIWKKASFFSRPEPDWEKVKKVSRETGAELTLVILTQISEYSDVDIYLYDAQKDQQFQIIKRAITRRNFSGSLRSVLDQVMRQYYKNQ